MNSAGIPQLNLAVGAAENNANLNVEHEDDSFDDEVFPFPKTSIVFHGWLNKRGAKKEASWKLHEVYVCLRERCE